MEGMFLLAKPFAVCVSVGSVNAVLCDCFTWWFSVFQLLIPLLCLYFSWLNPLFKKGREQPLEIDDMYNVTPQDSSDQLGADLER